MTDPARRPAMRAITFNDVGAAIDRLLEVARSDSGQSACVANFLLAWCNGPDNGHFPILHRANCDPTIGENMVIIMAYFAQEPTVYADAWDYRVAKVDFRTLARALTARPTGISTMAALQGAAIAREAAALNARVGALDRERVEADTIGALLQDLTSTLALLQDQPEAPRDAETDLRLCRAVVRR